MATNEYDLADEDRLPWLESADEEYQEGPAWRTVLLLVLIGLAIVAAAVFGIYWYKNRGLPVGNGALIAAPPGDYKVKPDSPGGMTIDGEGEAALAASQGGAPGNAAIDLNGVSEMPIQGQKAAPGAAPQVGNGAIAVPGSGGRLTAAPAGSNRPLPTAAGAGGAVVQLGSFPDEAEANANWAARSRRFAYLAPLGKSVEKADVNGKTVYRLRVNAGSAGAAQELCGKLKIAGEACFIPN